MARQPSRIRVLARTAVVALAALLLLIQLVPYGRAHSNPPVRAEPPWDSPSTRQLAVVACFDCHSNQTVWPWYSNVAPASWLLQWDVDRGRHKLNFSEWDRQQEEADDAAESVQKGEMPPRYYLPLHPEAQLTPEESDLLVAGLLATLGGEGSDDERSGRGTGGGGEGDDDDRNDDDDEDED